MTIPLSVTRPITDLMLWHISLEKYPTPPPPPRDPKQNLSHSFTGGLYKSKIGISKEFHTVMKSVISLEVCTGRSYLGNGWLRPRAMALWSSQRLDQRLGYPERRSAVLGPGLQPIGQLGIDGWQMVHSWTVHQCLLGNLSKMLNSNEQFEMDVSFNLSFIHVSGAPIRDCKKRKGKPFYWVINPPSI